MSTVESGGSHNQEGVTDAVTETLNAMSMCTLKTKCGLYPKAGCDSISLTLMEVVQKIQSEGMLSSYA